MSLSPPSISAGLDEVVLERGTLRLEVALRPFALTLRRFGRRLMRSGEAWVAEGEVNDRFVQFTEGVIARDVIEALPEARNADG